MNLEVVMARRAKTGGLQEVILALGKQLRSALLHAAKAHAPRRGPGRPRSTARCEVPRCSRRAVARGLCATHYRKAHRIGLTGRLGPAHLRELAQDGRKTRFRRAA